MPCFLPFAPPVRRRCALLLTRAPSGQVTESLKLANIDKDGKIDYREFAKVLLPQPLPRR